jgi:REP element-mobilizing transposase RayT
VVKPQHPGALHYVTGNFLIVSRYSKIPNAVELFLDELRDLNQKWPSKLITYVLMPDHFHLIVNPRDGQIREYTGHLKATTAKAIINRILASHSQTRDWPPSLAREVSRVWACGVPG